MSEQDTDMALASPAANQAIRIIVQEHQALWRILDLLDLLLSDMNVNEQRPDERLFVKIFDYIEHFSHRVHSTPTDIELYKRLGARSPETVPLLDKLSRGYRVGHERLQELRHLLAQCMTHWPEAREPFSHALARFTEALRKHIRKEEGVVIPRARKLLSEDDWAHIIESRDVENDPLFGERVRGGVPRTAPRDHQLHAGTLWRAGPDPERAGPGSGRRRRHAGGAGAGHRLWPDRGAARHRPAHQPG